MSDDAKRAVARDAAAKALEDDEPLRWFEELYAAGDAASIPWADMEPNPNVVAALNQRNLPGEGLRALKVGCGLGDDAEELARHGFTVTAFDVAPAAIEWAKKRFPDSPVDYQLADLLNPPRKWKRAFDFVLESYTLQVLPSSLRREAMTRIASFVKPGGTLLVIARARRENEPIGRMPWPLTREELLWFGRLGLETESFEELWDQEDPPVRRFRVEYRMPLSAA
jgi:2-polyprenyl-3-methyl-5-hydroxy-6-metoxy-1,4-benzoquinol methylase